MTEGINGILLSFDVNLHQLILRVEVDSVFKGFGQRSGVVLVV